MPHFEQKSMRLLTHVNRPSLVVYAPAQTMVPGARTSRVDGDTIAGMDSVHASPDWFDRIVAFLFATIVVLGIAVVVLAFVVYFPGTSTSNLPLP